MTRPRRAVEDALRRKGFVEEQKDHRYFYLYDEQGRRTAIFTKTSHSPSHKDLGAPLLGQMAKQCGLKLPEFLELVDCTLDEVRYRALLRDRGPL